MSKRISATELNLRCLFLWHTTWQDALHAYGKCGKKMTKTCVVDSMACNCCSTLYIIICTTDLVLDNELLVNSQKFAITDDLVVRPLECSCNRPMNHWNKLTMLQIISDCFIQSITWNSSFREGWKFIHLPLISYWHVVASKSNVMVTVYKSNCWCEKILLSQTECESQVGLWTTKTFSYLALCFRIAQYQNKNREILRLWHTNNSVLATDLYILRLI